MNEKEEKLLFLVKQSLTSDLLEEPFSNGKFNTRPNNKFFGHCFSASEALYRLLGEKESGYKVKRAVDCTNSPHYWVLSPTNEILDATVDQYHSIGNPVPYGNNAKGSSYRFKSRAANEIIKRVEKLLEDEC